MTPLSKIIYNGYETIVKLFVKRDDIEIDSKNKNSRISLSKAIYSEYEAIVKLLVERNDVEADSKNKNN
jgi:hypothetical protein